jgi:hypothetical protein
VSGAAPARARGALQLGLAWLAVFALLREAIAEPPVWDAATGLFPAAFVLAENGFDLLDLLSRPGWAHGGPNIHQLSAVTWLTALLVWVVPAREVWLPLLHVLHFAIAAGTLVGAWRLAALVLPRAPAAAVAAATLASPLFQVQAASLYTEMPLALCTVWAVHAAARDRLGRALVWSALACAVKEAGVIVPVALAAAAALSRGPARRRLARTSLLLLPAAASIALQLGVSVPVEAAWGVRPIPWSEQLRDVARKLRVVPDLALLLAGFAAFAAAALPEARRALREGEGGAASRARALSILLLGAFAGFHLLVSTTGVEVYVLPRYYVQVLPLVLIGCADLARRLVSARAALAAPALLALFFALNRHGDFAGLYPEVVGNEFSLAERSLEYRDLLAAQRELVAAASGLPPELPVYYGLHEHFLFAYPRLGYAPAPLRGGRCIWLDAGLRRARLADLPERFAILYDFIGYGGVQLQALVREAERDPARRVRATAFQRGRYRTLLFVVEPAAGRGST